MSAGALSPPAPSRRSRNWRLAACALLALAFVPSFGIGFLLDDNFLVARAGRSLAHGALRFAIRGDDAGLVLWPHPIPVHVEFFRPLVMLSLWVERHLWGVFAPLYHVDNILMHVCVAVLLAKLARRLGLGGNALRLAVLGWCLSVPGVTAADWVAGRTEIIAAACALGAILAFLAWRDGGGARPLAVAVALSGLAACAKESGVMTPLLIAIASNLADAAPRPAVDRRPRRPSTPVAYALVVAPVLAALFVRFFVLRLRAPEPPYLEPLWGWAAWTRLALEVPLQVLFSLASFPVSHIGPLDAVFARPPLLLGALVAVAALAIVLARAAGAWRASLLLAWFAVALAPSLPVVATSLYAYLPMAGLALLLGFALQTSGRRAFAVWLGLWIVLGIGGSVATSLAGRRATQAVHETVAFVARETAGGGTARVAVIDAPFLMYALPAAFRLEHPESRLETWFVNCDPGVAAGRASELSLTPDGGLDVRSRDGGFFQSPIQRFLAFGGRPDRARPASGAAMRVEPLEPGANPAAVRISFRDATARDSTCVIQFRGWTPMRVTWRGGATPELRSSATAESGSGAAPALSLAAPSRPAPARR
jgi:hypothetical protein